MEQVVGHDFDSLMVAHLLRPKLINAHLVEAFTELADRVWDDRNALKHLSCDRIDDIEKLDKHLFVEGLLTFRLHVLASHAVLTVSMG